MKKQMANAKTDEEREKIMMEYANNLQKLTDALEKQKQSHLQKLRQELLDRRRQRKKVNFTYSRLKIFQRFYIHKFILKNTCVTKKSIFFENNFKIGVTQAAHCGS